MSIMATRIQPIRELRSEEHICRRCGIDYKGRASSEYCTDCRGHAKKGT
ncbi:hypothetical protein ABIB35_001527 [Arthrobacter sp. UYP6]